MLKDSISLIEISLNIELLKWLVYINFNMDSNYFDVDLPGFFLPKITSGNQPHLLINQPNIYKTSLILNINKHYQVGDLLV